MGEPIQPVARGAECGRFGSAEEQMAELFHVGLTVKDLERSLRFYRDAAGMTAGEIFDGQSQEFDSLTNNRGARLPECI